jgi:hypothetical protein
MTHLSSAMKYCLLLRLIDFAKRACADLFKEGIVLTGHYFCDASKSASQLNFFDARLARERQDENLVLSDFQEITSRAHIYFMWIYTYWVVIK